MEDKNGEPGPGIQAPLNLELTCILSEDKNGEPSSYAANLGQQLDEPEYDPSDQDDISQFPITHEISLKDHTKVVSVLSLDPSGTCIVSGSHETRPTTKL